MLRLPPDCVEIKAVRIITKSLDCHVRCVICRMGEVLCIDLLCLRSFWWRRWRLSFLVCLHREWKGKMTTRIVVREERRRRGGRSLGERLIPQILSIFSALPPHVVPPLKNFRFLLTSVSSGVTKIYQNWFPVHRSVCIYIQFFCIYFSITFNLELVRNKLREASITIWPEPNQTP